MKGTLDLPVRDDKYREFDVRVVTIEILTFVYRKTFRSRVNVNLYRKVAKTIVTIVTTLNSN